MQTTCAHDPQGHASARGVRAPMHVDLRPLRVAAAAMLGLAVVWPLLPVPGVTTCPLRLVTGVPCPFCGMTRAVVAAVHGDFVSSLVFNPGGIAIVVLAVALVASWRIRRVAIPAWTLFAWFSALWVYQLFKYTTGRPL